MCVLGFFNGIFRIYKKVKKMFIFTIIVIIIIDLLILFVYNMSYYIYIFILGFLINHSFLQDVDNVGTNLIKHP